MLRSASKPSGWPEHMPLDARAARTSARTRAAKTGRDDRSQKNHVSADDVVSRPAMRKLSTMSLSASSSPCSALATNHDRTEVVSVVVDRRARPPAPGTDDAHDEPVLVRDDLLEPPLSADVEPLLDLPRDLDGVQKCQAWSSTTTSSFRPSTEVTLC